MSKLVCLVCGRSMPALDSDDEPQGGRICHRHLLPELVALGVIGLPTDLATFHAPVAELQRAVQGQRVSAWFGEPNGALVIGEFDNGYLCLFPCHHRTAFAQWIPTDATCVLPSNAGLEQLAGMGLPSAATGFPELVVAGLRKTVTKACPIAGLGYGEDQRGDALEDVISIHFSGCGVLTVEAVGWSFYDDAAAQQLALKWTED